MSGSVTIDFSAYFGANSGYVEELYKQYLNDPSLVGESWAGFFSSLSKMAEAINGGRQHAISPAGEIFEEPNGRAAIAEIGETSVDVAISTRLQERVFRLVNAYRSFGHLKAKINPLSKGVLPFPQTAELDPHYYGFTESELNQEVSCDGFRSKARMRLGDLISELQEVYCGSIGFEYTHLLSEEERAWLQNKIENRFSHSYELSTEQKLRKLKVLVEAESFEAELHKKYVGHKRFSLEGGETLMPMLDTALDEGQQRGIKEALIGMAHRGRLNVLVNAIGKPMEEIFNEFEDQSIYSALGSGDVKYHLGYSSSYQTASGGEVRLSLACNPSHLEFVDPVLEGMARARQDLYYNKDRKSVLPLLIHGDAAFIGQGVVPETLNLSLVRGYRTGGSLHIVINNQIGFTTNPEDARSSIYCTDMAKAVLAPVFHVNCEDVEAACWITKLAIEFRMRYERDVVIDLYCYRRYGHNEGDDPSFTQPLSYSEIRKKKTAARIYGAELIAKGELTADAVEKLYSEFKERFEHAQSRKSPKVQGEACPMHGRLRVPTPETGVALENLHRVAQSLVNYPEGFVPHPKLKTILEKRVETLTSGSGIDWGFAEALAFGSLMLEGKRIRLSGQDSGRGTFSHRHLALNNHEAPEIYLPLTRLVEQGAQGSFEVYNSTLSEAAVLGFEFGYASEAPQALVMWEAQFGDFSNGAQVVIDQFIVSSEAKWHQLSGVTMLLPHGFEGQGPEHSSARLERFLQLCGEGNIVVCYPTTASQYFHLLRRQGLIDMKRPLVVMTPKSLLRLPEATCATSDLTSGKFETVLENDYALNPKECSLVMTSGKIYYDLAAALQKAERPNAKLVRFEQLYPFPQFEIKKALKDLNIKTAIWVQEEPQNMGAWSYIEPYLRGKLGLDAVYVGRDVAASPATGSGKRHAQEQQAIVNEVLRLIS
ncbi:MAG: 2-oxoglutarate dehydrogenase E1 component [Deltaproteobacteria bacterium]|nr:2-oxoglutarate dehydrogenase E1 component [Deltaproteobacteria bacterium]